MIIHPRPVFCFYFFLRFCSKSLNNFRVEKNRIVSDGAGFFWFSSVEEWGWIAQLPKGDDVTRPISASIETWIRKTTFFFNFFVLFISARKIFKWPRFGSHVTREARADSPHISNIGQRKIPSGNLAISDPQNVTHFTIFLIQNHNFFEIDYLISEKVYRDKTLQLNIFKWKVFYASQVQN